MTAVINVFKDIEKKKQQTKKPLRSAISMPQASQISYEQ